MWDGAGFDNPAWRPSMTGMSKLTDFTSYADAQRHFSGAGLWALFDGDRERLNIAHECVDRWAAGPDRTAVRIAYGDGTTEEIGFHQLSAWSSRFAHWLRRRGIEPGDRVAIMLEPSLPFYAALFGAMKAGAVAVPLFTLFGPDGVRLRVDDCSPRLLLTNAEKSASTGPLDRTETVVTDDAFMAGLRDFSERFAVETRADDMAMYQYTSGTTRDLPAAIKHTHRAVVVVANAALYGTGVRPGDRFFCPSSPAWGHGLWHGTLAPLGLGVETGTFSGRFDPVLLLKAISGFGITNLSAAATHYRMMKNSGAVERYTYAIRKMSFTGEPVDSDTLAWTDAVFGTRLCSMYGTTEVGVILADYPGAEDFPGRPGSLGKPVPGVKVAVIGPDGTESGTGEIKVWRHNAWFPTKDRGRVDADGYFWHGGRADDAIISAGWTIGTTEVEDALLKHPAVREAAVIGVPDALRGQVIKAFIVVDRVHDGLAEDIQSFVRARLSQHEYPRIVQFMDELPKTPAGKVNRKTLRDREAAL